MREAKEKEEGKGEHVSEDRREVRDDRLDSEEM